MPSNEFQKPHRLGHHRGGLGNERFSVIHRPVRPVFGHGAKAGPPAVRRIALVLLIFPVARSMSGGAYPVYLRIWDWVLITASAASLLHIVATYKDLVSRGGAATDTDLWLGGLVILLVLETTRRVMGPSLPIITVVAIAYTLLGHHIPGMWGHRLIDLEQLISYQYLTTEGLFTIPLGVSASFIFIFILFGAFLVASGTGEFFIKFANALAGHLRGGPAKVAVLSSATFGSISGSAVANVVSTGSFTIPLMKKIGYRPVFAGAIESVASTGGQFMPPVMGAAAFIIADMLGVTYLVVCKAALIPAVLYFFALIYMVHLEARRRDLRGLNRSELPNLIKTVKEGGHLLLPAVLLVILLVQGYSPMKAGLWALVAVVVISWFKKETRMGPKAILVAMEKGAKGSLEVALACACAGIVIGCVTQSGLGLKFSSLVIQASGGSLILSLVFVMVASLVLGMGLTTSAAYILTIILAGPVLVDLGVAPAGGPYVRVLLRLPVLHHPAGGPGRLCRRGPGRVQALFHRVRVHAPGHHRLHRAFHLRLSPGADLAGGLVGHRLVICHRRSGLHGHRLGPDGLHELPHQLAAAPGLDWRRPSA